MQYRVGSTSVIAPRVSDPSKSALSNSDDENSVASTVCSTMQLLKGGANVESGVVEEPFIQCIVENIGGLKEGEIDATGGMQRGPMGWCVRHLSSSFWTRTSLVMILAISVMATTLFVLRLYHVTVYEEARRLGHDLQQEITHLAEMEITAFIGDMVPGVLVLAGNFQRQGLADAVVNNPQDPRARRMLWQTLKARPRAEVVGYETEVESHIYMWFRRPGVEPAPMLIEAGPENQDLPYENWTARLMPVDPNAGDPLIVTPKLPFPPSNLEAHYVEGMAHPAGFVHWWIGPGRVEDGQYFMSYVATCTVLSAESTAGDSRALTASNSSITTGAVASQAAGVVGLGYSARALSESIQQLELRGGRLFFSRMEGGIMVLVNKGRLFVEGEGATAPSPITADQSDDPVIAAAARHLRKTFSKVAQNEAIADAGVSEDEDAANAAAAGLCWKAYDDLITIDGRQWYLHCQGKVYGGAKGRLPLVGVLLVPREAIMGHVDASKHHALLVVVGVTVAILVVGMAFVYASTVHVELMARRKKALEGQVLDQEGEIRGMARELDAMRSLLPGRSRNSLDLRTPMEKVNDLLAELAQGGQGGPIPDALAAIQRLLRMPELHMPILLQQSLGLREGPGGLDGVSPLPGQLAGEGTQPLDDDTTTWLRSTVMRLSASAPQPSSLSRKNSTWHFNSEPGALAGGHSGSDGKSVSPSGFSEEIDLGAVSEAVGLSAWMTKDAVREDAALVADQGERSVAAMVASLPGATRDLDGMHSPPASASFAPQLRSLNGRLQGVLDKVGEWSFDAWELMDVSAGQPIMWMGLEVLRRLSLVRDFHLPLKKLVRFLAALDDGMPTNRYHNRAHMADVTNSLFHLLQYSGVGAYLTRLDRLAVVIAALVHDFRHPGLNNDFVVKSSDTLALRYNDRTVLENYHVAEAYILLADADLNFLEVLDQDDAKYVRRMVIEIVLASDLKRHFELVESFKVRAKDKESPLSKSSEGDRLLLMQVALKVADIGHSAKTLAIHRRWTDAITEEFYLQGDKERAAGFKVSPFMDRDNNNLAKSQLGFFSFIAFPLFEAWVATFPDSQPIMEEMTANIKYWETVRDAALG